MRRIITKHIICYLFSNIIVLGAHLHVEAANPRVDFIVNDVKQATADGQISEVKLGDEIQKNDTIRLGDESICEIALDNGNVFVRLDKPGDFAMRDLFTAEGQNNPALDLQTRLALKWKRVSSVLPRYSETIMLPGIRGGIVRPGVAKIRPGLEKSSFPEPFFLAAQNGIAAAIWHSQYYDDQEICFAKLLPNQPPHITRLTNSKGESCWPWLAGDPNGNLYAAWEDGRAGGKREIYFKYSEDGGNSWSSAIRITDHGKGAYNPILWVSGSNLLLVWENARNGIFMRKSPDQGKTWQQEKQLVKGRVSWPQISGTPENLWMLWIEKNKKNQVIYAMQSIDGGVNWGKPHRIVKSRKGLGQPALQSLSDKGVCVAWRDSRKKPSAIYTRTSLDNKRWLDEIRAIKGDRYNEYPGIISTEEGLALFYYSPTFNWNYTWITQSQDQGINWSEPLRVPGITNNVEKSYFITNFELPWDRSIYSNHDMTFKINDQIIGKLENTIPEGQCLFEFDPRLLQYSSAGQAKNKVSFNTRKLNGGNYYINNGFKVVQSMTQQEMMVVATSQAEADKIAQTLLPEQVNHALPDVGVFGNKIAGLPEKRNQPGPVILEVEVFNLGAATAKNIEVYIAKGAWGEDVLLSSKTRISNLPPLSSRSIKLSFQYDGALYQAAVVAKTVGKDSDLENNLWMFRMGYEKKGKLKVQAEVGDIIVVSRQSTLKEKARFKSGDVVELPIGVYKISTEGPKVHVRENVAIKGGKTTRIYFESKGTLQVDAPEDYSVKISQNNVVVTDTKCNQEVLLEPGFYQLEVDCKAEGITRYQDILVASRKLIKLSVRLGFIGVSSLGNYPSKLFYPDGTFFREIPGAEYIRVPTGMYQVKVKPTDFPEVDLGFAMVKENEHLKMQLTGFGQIGVSSVGEWDYSLYTSKGKKLMDIPGGKLFCTIVPIGTYNVKVKPKEYAEIDMGWVTIKENDVVKLKTPGFGKIGVESPGNWDYSLFYRDGRKFMDIKGDELSYTVVPSGTYVVKVYPKEYPEINLGEIIIKEDQVVKQKVPGYGWIGITSPGKWDGLLLHPAGQEFKTIKGDSYKYSIVPEGTYIVKVNPEPYPEMNLGKYIVKAYEKTRVKVKGFGQIGVESLGNWDSVLYTTDGTKFCDLKVRDIYFKVVPVGTYIVKVKADPYPVINLGKVEVEDGKPTRLKVKGFGQLGISPRGNYMVELYYPDGRKLRDIDASSIYYNVVPIGEYVVKVEGKKVGKVKITEKGKTKVETGRQP
ncbi:exo-alpha-sialidase [bacterium]|nr:exo-alpha-sialidase [bacterium]